MRATSAFDLHLHSCHSDGALPAAELIRRAAANGVRAVALTDHDELSGLAEARAAAEQTAVRFIDGVEISVTWHEHTIHIVGLNIDPADATLREGLAQIRRQRDERAARMDAALAEMGVENALAGARSHAANPALVSRTHFARHLVASGVVRSIAAAFSRYLAYDRPGYVPQRWVSLGEAVHWIRTSGGEAVLAHPGRYRITATEWSGLLGEFRDSGGGALEVVSGSHSDAETQTFAGRARRFGLRGSCGSDFHAPNESRLDAGRLPALPPGCTPVWQQWDCR